MDDPASLRDSDTLVVVLDRVIDEKSDLLRWLAVNLRFPAYFGENWDALDEMLRDLSWIDEFRVVLFHSALPLASNRGDRAVYVDILRDSVAAWHPGDDHELIVGWSSTLARVF